MSLSTHPHQIHFEILSEQGLLGYFIFILFLFNYLKENPAIAEEIEAIKDILTDRQSANYKDLENQIIKKLDVQLDLFVPDASNPVLAFIDFENGLTPYLESGDNSESIYVEYVR